jgi:hypothetical protein
MEFSLVYVEVVRAQRIKHGWIRKSFKLSHKVRLRWLKEVGNDLWDLKVKIWRQKVHNGWNDICRASQRAKQPRSKSVGI